MKKLIKRNHTNLDTAGQQMYKLIKEGYTVEEVAEAYSVSLSECEEIIKRYKAELEYKQLSKGRAYEHTDMGKANALARAGWNIEKIAEEFDTTVKEMKKIIRQYQHDTGKEIYV